MTGEKFGHQVSIFDYRRKEKKDEKDKKDKKYVCLKIVQSQGGPQYFTSRWKTKYLYHK